MANANARDANPEFLSKSSNGSCKDTDSSRRICPVGSPKVAIIVCARRTSDPLGIQNENVAPGPSTLGIAASHLLERCYHPILIKTAVPDVSFGVDPNL